MKIFKLGALILPVVVAIATFPVNAQERIANYRCNGGRTFEATFLRNSARVRLERNRTITLPQVRSASGARYSDGRTTLSTKGNEAFIEVNNRRVFEQCVTQVALGSPMTTQPRLRGYGSVSGTVTYRQRIALPPNAVVQVKLIEVSRPNTPTVTLAEQTITSPGQVPIRFELTYDRSQIDPNRTYAIQALIFIDNQIRYMNTSAYPVITQGNPTNVEVVVNPANREMAEDKKP